MEVLMWLLFSLLSSLVSLAITAAPGDHDVICGSPRDRVLLDSTFYSDLIDTWMTVATVNGSSDTNLTAWTASGADCMQSVESCVQNDTNRANWLITQFISFETVAANSGFTINVELNLSMCMDCENFNLYVFQTDGEDVDNAQNLDNYESVDTVTFGVGVTEVELQTTSRGVYLALQDSGSCVNVTQLRVFYQRCEASIIDFIQYGETLNGLVTTGSCVANANQSGTLMATCNDGSFVPSQGSSCVCVSGTIGNQDQTNCTGCIQNYFMVGNSCTMCPDHSESNSPYSTYCNCIANTVTSSGADTTNGEPCSGCMVNFVLNGGGSCVECPQNSGRTGAPFDSCMCSEGMVTSSGENTTTIEMCTACAGDYYKNNGVCTSCPTNSIRPFGMDEGSCPCDDNYQRKDMMNSAEPCFPIVGFNQSTLMISEGSSPRQQDVALYLSTSTDVVVSVTIGEMSSSVEFMEPSTTQYVMVPVGGDSRALEENSVINVVIVDSDGYVVGNADPYYGQIQITFIEDDEVFVGFNESMRTFKQSGGMVVVYVVRIGEIATDMKIQVLGDDPSGRNVIDTSVEFKPNGPSKLPATLDIPDGEDSINLRLEVVSPTQFADQINVASSDSDLEPVLRLEVEDDSGQPFPITIVVPVIAGVVVALLLLVIILLICVCVCKWRISQQGYYTTYEDKTSEPPTMLRYSASLRSISSQTVVPATESRSAAAGSKEHEFYV